LEDWKIVKFREVLVAITVSLLYLLASYLLIGWKTEQLVLIALCNTLYFASMATRKFILGFAVFVVFWILFDSMKAFPNYNFNTVHIKSLYDAELNLFGIPVANKTITPNEYWHIHQHTAIDVLSGIFYLCWMPVPLIFAGYLFYTDRMLFLRFALTFLLVNLIGFVVYYIYPAAPPWYVQIYGFDFDPNIPGNTAGLGRFDAYFNSSIFASLYAKSSNVFAAMPSLHAAYPVVVLYFGLKNKMGLVNIVFGLVAIGIWFSAIYSNHHYILDVLAGILCAIIGICLFNWLLAGKWAHRWFIKYAEAIE
jgi:membrane-associated phospholipid phosphatase